MLHLQNCGHQTDQEFHQIAVLFNSYRELLAGSFLEFVL